MNADRLIVIIILICIGLELTAKEAHFAMYYPKISCILVSLYCTARYYSLSISQEQQMLSLVHF